MRDFVVQMVGLGYREKSKWLVNDLNIHIGKQEIYSFYSPGESVKEMIFRMLIGLLKPTHGSVMLFNKKIPAERDKVIRRIGVMDSYYALYENLTVNENLSFHAKLLGISIEEKLNELLSFMRMDNLREHVVGKLSNENKARLGLIRALSHNPELLVLNDPTLLFDRALRKRVWNLLIEFSISRAMTLVILTKDAEEAVYVGSRVGILTENRTYKEYDCNLFNSQKETYIELTVDNPSKTAFVLENVWGLNTYRCLENNHMVIFHHSIPAMTINRILNEKGIGVSRFNPVTESLAQHLLKGGKEN